MLVSATGDHTTRLSGDAWLAAVDTSPREARRDERDAACMSQGDRERARPLRLRPRPYAAASRLFRSAPRALRSARVYDLS